MKNSTVVMWLSFIAICLGLAVILHEVNDDKFKRECVASGYLVRETPNKPRMSCVNPATGEVVRAR